MIVIPLPDPIDHHALAQVGGVVPTPKSAALAPQEICTDLIRSGISDVNPLAKWRFHPNSQAHLWWTNRCSIIWKHRSNRRSTWSLFRTRRVKRRRTLPTASSKESDAGGSTSSRHERLGKPGSRKRHIQANRRKIIPRNTRRSKAQTLGSLMLRSRQAFTSEN